MDDNVTIENGHVCGPWCRPVNTAANIAGSIHDDAAAQKLGFQGGFVPGVVLLDLFPPLLAAVFGRGWFERGCISVSVERPLYNEEEARAVVDLPPEGAADVQVRACLEKRDGSRPVVGTASRGDCGVPSALHARPYGVREGYELRIFAKMKPGDPVFGPAEVTIEPGKPGPLPEILDWHKRKWPWAGDLPTLREIFHAIAEPMWYQPARERAARSGEAPERSQRSSIGVAGAHEFQIVNGPLRYGHVYLASGVVVAVGTTATTEYWVRDVYLDEPDGTRVMVMRGVPRMLKASSPLYNR